MVIASLVHLLVAVILAGLVAIGARVWSRDGRPPTLIVVAVAAGLVYDNAVLGAGHWLGHGPVLEALSWPRFVIHALLTPLLILPGRAAAAAFGLRWARQPASRAAFAAAALVLVAVGVVSDVVLLRLEAQADAGVTSYGNAAAAVPVPAIVTMVVLLVIGMMLWRASSWPWLALGAAVMFVTSAFGGLLTNLGELSLLASLVATEDRAGRRVGTDPSRRRQGPNTLAIDG